MVQAIGGSQGMSGVLFDNVSFAGAYLAGRDLSGSAFIKCNFDAADLTDANCSRSEFTGSSFRRSICTRTNFAGAKLGATVFEPDDCYGMTITLTCETFKNASVGQMQWFSWLMFLASMATTLGPVKTDLRGGLLALIGAERYVKLKALFARREM